MTGTEITTEKTAAKKPADSNWLVDNIAHPFANAAALEPYNAVASVVNAIHHNSLPELTLLSVPEASGVAWLTQSFSGGVGGLLPFVVAGKLTGSGMRGTGRFLESANLIEGGGLAAKALASERLAMITGAGLYGVAQKPQDGQTRLGNAAASVVGMGAFELGGKLSEGTPIMSLAGFGNRAVVGFAGGSVGSMTGNYLNSWMTTGHGSIGSLDGIAKAGVSGAALNMFLPVAQRGVDSLKLQVGMSIPAKNFAAREGWGQNEELSKIVDRSPLTNVKRTDGAPSIDQDANVVRMPADGKASQLGHEVAHRVALNADESQFQAVAAAHLDPAKPENFNEDLAKQKYVDIRVGQEQAAREAQNRVAGNNEVATDPQSILEAKAEDGLTYKEKFEQEAQQFAKDGKFRPAEDNSGINPTTKLMEQIYNPPVAKEYGLTSIYEETPPTVKPEDQFKRFTIVDDNGQLTKLVEVYKNLKETREGFGTAKVLERLPNEGVRYHIIKGGLNIPDNSLVELYPKGKGIDTPFGKTEMTITDPANGRTSYRRADGTQAFEYSTPQELWTGVEFNSEEEQPGNGRTIYHLTDGGTAEYYQGGMHADLVTPKSTKPLDFSTVARQSGGRTSYVLNDGNLMIIDNDGSKLTGTLYNNDMQVAGRFDPSHISETYPGGTTVTVGDTTLSNVQTIEHRVDSDIYRSPDSSTQIYDENHVLTTPFGDVRRVDFLPNQFTRYFQDDGTQILTNANPYGIKSPYGLVKSISELPDHTTSYTRANGDSVVVYPSDINVLVGGAGSGLFGGELVKVNSVEQVKNGLILRSEPGSQGWSSAVVDFADHSINTYDSGGGLMGSRDIPSGYKLVRQFPPANYPDGVMSPYGPVRSIETDENGANTWKLTDGSVHSDAQKQAARVKTSVPDDDYRRPAASLTAVANNVPMTEVEAAPPAQIIGAQNAEVAGEPDDMVQIDQINARFANLDAGILEVFANKGDFPVSTPPNHADDDPHGPDPHGPDPHG